MILKKKNQNQVPPILPAHLPLVLHLPVVLLLIQTKKQETLGKGKRKKVKGKKREWEKKKEKYGIDCFGNFVLFAVELYYFYSLFY
jgi:hypothetical protein